jgi:hypothetical protein
MADKQIKVMISNNPEEGEPTKEAERLIAQGLVKSGVFLIEQTDGSCSVLGYAVTSDSAADLLQAAVVAFARMAECLERSQVSGDDTAVPELGLPLATDSVDINSIAADWAEFMQMAVPDATPKKLVREFRRIFYAAEMRMLERTLDVYGPHPAMSPARDELIRFMQEEQGGSRPN